MNLIKTHCLKKFICVINLYLLPHILNTTRPAFKILALGYSFLMSVGLVHLALLASLYHVFNWSSEPECFSQKSRSIFLATTLIKFFINLLTKIIKSYQCGNFVDVFLLHYAVMAFLLTPGYRASTLKTLNSFGSILSKLLLSRGLSQTLFFCFAKHAQKPQRH